MRSIINSSVASSNYITGDLWRGTLVNNYVCFYIPFDFITSSLLKNSTNSDYTDKRLDFTD